MPPDRSYSYTGMPSSSSSLQNKGEGSSAGAISPPPPALPRARAISVSVKPSSAPTTKAANSNGQSDDRRIQSASPPSAMSPPARDGAAPVKQQKACIHCRKSKVKCQHEGAPPCRRCIDGNLECKFRLRAVSPRVESRECCEARRSRIAHLSSPPCSLCFHRTTRTGENEQTRPCRSSVLPSMLCYIVGVLPHPLVIPSSILTCLPPLYRVRVKLGIRIALLLSQM